MHVHVEVLTLAGEIAVHDRDQRRDDGPVAAGLVALIAAPAYWRQRVVVVAARPRRPAAREQREVGGLLGGAWTAAPERRDRGHDQLGVILREVGVVEAPPGHLPWRLVLDHYV